MMNECATNIDRGQDAAAFDDLNCFYIGNYTVIGAFNDGLDK